ncbi:SusC/RagA family TonB-linked outer membrane protein [Pedobacter frigoris]|uniref:SusC/RagA family TonB-linked outer membrane protein n=1 Tax=Pedobacter frigoris TaxID=2571272 RepID=UPI00292D6D2A|nr:SusC/RagA family TonB-linked outer membrane protein [Pedobacter frigoris]
MIIIIMTTCLMQVSAASFAQKINLVRKNASLATVLDQISKQSGYQVLYSSEKIDVNKRMDVNFRNTDLKEVLETCLIKQGFSYAIEDNVIMIKKKEPSLLDKAKSLLPAVILNLFQDLRGRVLDANGDPLEGATIVIKGTNRTAKTNAKGEFMITKVPEDAVLVIRYVGYKTLEIPLKGAVLPLEIRLNVETGELEEVKVTYSTGYQDVPKERATGSFEFISGEELNKRAGSDILSRLEGVTTSIFFDKRSTLPRDNGTVLNNLTIRGLSTLDGNIKAPLVVVDNFPYDGNINNINPNDVESITILKDAAAASIWGARAGNGVIVIKTKKGQVNQPFRLSFNSNYTMTEKPDLFHFPRVTSAEVVDVETFLFGKGYYNSLIGDTFEYPALKEVPEILLKRKSGLISAADSALLIDNLKAHDVRHDFEKYVYQTALSQQYALNLSGGSDKITYSLSGGLDQMPSILKRDNYRRITLNSDNSFSPLKDLVIQAGIRFTDAKTENNSLGDIFSNAYTVGGNAFPLYTKLADDNGNFLTTAYQYREGYTDTVGGGKLLDWKYRPLEELSNTDYKIKEREFVINTGLSYKMASFLSIRMDYQYQFASIILGRYYNKNTYYVRDLVNSYTNLKSTIPNKRYPVPNGGIIDANYGGRTAQMGRAQLNFDHLWDEKHQLNGLFGTEIRENISEGSSKRSYGYDKNRLTTVSVDFIDPYPVYGDKGDARIPSGSNGYIRSTNHFISLFGNIAYTYKDRYTLSASGRRDAANQFGVNINDQWKPFWSAGASWNISNEAFYKSKIISYVRVRATYGYQGNVNNRLSPYTIISYSAASTASNNMPYAGISTPANPGLSWESVKQINAAVDFRIAGNRLSGSVDVYQKNATDLILSIPIAPTSGIGSASKNSASMRTSGIDVNINSFNVNKKIQWRTDLGLSHVSNKVTDFVAANVLPNLVGVVSEKGLFITPRMNLPPYAIFSYPFAGLDPLTGDPQGYLGQKVSKDYIKIANQGIDTAKVIYHGSAVPTIFGNLNNSFSYKGISLDVNVSYRFNYYFRKNTISYNALYGAGLANSDYSKRWKQPGDEKITTIPSMIYPTGGPSRDQFYAFSSINVLKADNIKLNYIRIAYDMNKASIKKLPVQHVQFYFNINNLGILWRANKEGLDPDYDANNLLYLPPKQIIMGLKVDF